MTSQHIKELAIEEGGNYNMCSTIKIAGYELLGPKGQDGLRFVWEYMNKNILIESVAFPQRSTRIDDGVCGYTTSVSAGCMLRTFHSQCSFCRTGTLLPFYGPLSYRDIAKQNIFMVLADMNCENHVELRCRPREFAYMGQGEPGLSYSQIRLAIELTNRVMKELGQSVYRHVFATCGIPESIIAYKQDLQNYFTEKVTLHFSLHATEYRELLMPIDKRYSYGEVLTLLEDIYAISGEKPCVGIMLFRNFQPNGHTFSYSNGFEEIKQILSKLNPEKFRLSFSEYNSSDDVCRSTSYSFEESNKILSYAKEQGFEAKLFSSFGREEQAACGTLGGKSPHNFASEKWKLLEKEAEKLINLCV